MGTTSDTGKRILDELLLLEQRLEKLQAAKPRNKRR